MREISTSRREALAALGAVGIALLAGCGSQGDTQKTTESPDGPNGIPQIDPEMVEIVDPGLAEQIHVHQRMADLPTPEENPSIGVTGEGYFIFTDGEWTGPIGVGSAENPATPSHFSSATVHGSMYAKQQILDGDIFDVRAYGATIDGETDDRSAIMRALDAAAEVSGTVFLPRGTAYISDRINLRNEHNGVTLQGQGYESQLRLAGGHSKNHAVVSLINDEGPVRDITVKDLRVDGNRANQNNDHGIGILTWDRADGGNDGNIRIENVWVHDCSLNGVDAQLQNTIFDGVSTWNNGKHGVRLYNVGGNNSFPIIANNISSWGNDMYGIDGAGGHLIVSNFACVNNNWGFKTANDGDKMIFTNGAVLNNTNLGFQMTSPADFVMLDNIESRGNGHTGFRFDQGGEVLAGNLVAINNNRNKEGNSNVFVGSADLYADSLITRDSAEGPGLYVEGRAYVGSLIGGGNAGPDVFVPNGGTLHVDNPQIESTQTAGQYVERNIAHVSLGGSPPNATQWSNGIFVHDTDSPNAVYLVYDDSRADGVTKISS